MRSHVSVRDAAAKGGNREQLSIGKPSAESQNVTSGILR